MLSSAGKVGYTKPTFERQVEHCRTCCYKQPMSLDTMGSPSHKRFTGVLSSLAVTVTLFSSPSKVMLAFSELAPPTTGAPLSLDQVVTYLVRRNDERYRRLAHSRATRVYHLSYRGIAGAFDAEMAVEAFYDSPSTKYFTIISESGPKMIVDRVLKKLLERETEASLPEVRARTLLNRDNYNFTLIGYERQANQYLLRVSPKKKSRYVYGGQIWIDGKDFAVTRIQAEPAQNPSFWTIKNEIRQGLCVSHANGFTSLPGQSVSNFWPKPLSTNSSVPRPAA